MVARQRQSTTTRPRHRLNLERQQRIRNLGRRRTLPRLRHTHRHPPHPPADAAAHDAKLLAGAARTQPARTPLPHLAQRLPRPTTLRPNLERRQPHQLAYPQMEHPHGRGYEPLRHVPHRPRHRRLRRAKTRRRTLPALDPKRAAPAALYHPLLERRPHRQRTVDAPIHHRRSARRHPPALPPHPLPLHPAVAGGNPRRSHRPPNLPRPRT